jgi:hypothetical protein
LETAEKALLLSLEEARNTTSHPGDKGGDVEAETRNLFEKFLPAGFSVGEGKVYDAFGDESAQADVVITNPDHPFRYPPNKTGAYLIEGVAAVGEVKSVLTKTELTSALEVGEKFKRLRPTFNPDDKIFGSKNRALGLLTGGAPPFFVLAFENEVATDTIVKMLVNCAPVPVPAGKEYPDGKGNIAQPPVDCVCVLGKGVALYMRPGEDLPIQFINAQGEFVTGWQWIKTHSPLAMTLAWLHAEMPRVVRAGSISLPYFAPLPAHVMYVQGQQTAD